MLQTMWVAAALGLIASAAVAQTGAIYKWTDERGIVHFGDVPPPNRPYTANEVAPPATIPPTADPAAAPGEGTPAAATTPGADDKKAAAKSEGPAKVVITKHDDTPFGDGGMHIAGEVKNEGGAEARSVGLKVRVVEPSQ